MNTQMTTIQRHSSMQTYLYANTTNEILKPEVGTILTRIDKETHEIQPYVVTKIFKKSRGTNSGIIDLIYLEKINSIIEDVITYTTTEYPMIIKLTNHGEWISHTIKLKYDYLWDTYLPSSSTTQPIMNKRHQNTVSLWTISKSPPKLLL